MEKCRLFWTNTNYFETWRLIVGGSDQSEIHEFDGFLLTDCGQPFAFMNLVFVQRPLKMAEESLDRVLRHFKARNLPAIICIPPGVDDTTETLVVSRKHKPATPAPGMTLFPIPPAPEKPRPPPTVGQSCERIAPPCNTRTTEPSSSSEDDTEAAPSPLFRNRQTAPKDPSRPQPRR